MKLINLFLRLYKAFFYIAKRSKNAVSEISTNSGYNDYAIMMELRFVPKEKNHLANPFCQIVILNQSPPQGKQSEAQCEGNTFLE